MVTYEGLSSSDNLFIKPNMEARIYRLLPCIGVINMIIGSGATIYREYANAHIPLISFLAFLCFSTFLFYHCYELYHQLPPQKLKLKIGIWLLLSAIVFGFGFQYSKLTRPAPALSFFWAVIGGNLLLLHVYLVWDGERNFSICSAGKRKIKRIRYIYRNRKAGEMKKRRLAVVVEHV